MKSLLPVCLSAMLLAGCDNALMRVPPPPIGPQLTAEQIGPMLAGNSLVTMPDEVPPLVIFFAEDGNLHGLRGNNYTDSGTWSIDDNDDTVCGAWNNWYGTMSRCWHVYRAGDRITLKRTEGSRVFTTMLAAGDVAGLR